MNRIKVYDADGNYVDSFNKALRDPKLGDVDKQFGLHNARIKHLNANGFYIKGQTTSKGVKIK